MAMPAWVAEPSKIRKLETRPRRAGPMTKAQFKRFMAGVPLKSVIEKPKTWSK